MRPPQTCFYVSILCIYFIYFFAILLCIFYLLLWICWPEATEQVDDMIFKNIGGNNNYVDFWHLPYPNIHTHTCTAAHTPTHTHTYVQAHYVSHTRHLLHFSHARTTYCSSLSRYASLLRACADRPLSEADLGSLDRHGMRSAAIGHTPQLWLQKYAADNLRFVEFERKALPCALMRPSRGQRSLYRWVVLGPWLCMECPCKSKDVKDITRLTCILTSVILFIATHT